MPLLPIFLRYFFGSFLLIVLLSPSILRAQDTATTPAVPATNAVVEDSLRKDSLRTNFKERLAKMTEPLYSNPTSVLSLYPQDSLTAYRLHRSDYATWVELLSAHPEITRVSYSPRTQMDRSLYRGYLTPMINPAQDPFQALGTPSLSQFTSEPAIVERAQIGVGTIGSAVRFPTTKVTPQFTFQWEGGLFGGNLLNIRFTRNLTRYLSLNVITAFQDLERQEYDYNTSNIDDINPSTPKIEGYNPLSASRRTAIAIAWEKRNRIEMGYLYSDLQQDVNYDTTAFDTKSGLTVAWHQQAHYLSQAYLASAFPVGEKITFRLDGQLDKDKANQKAATDGLKLSGNQGRQSLRTALDFQTHPVNRLTTEGTFTRHEVQRYSRDTVLFHTTQALLKEQLSFGGSNLFSLNLAGGFDRYSTANTPEYSPVATSDLLLKVRYLNLSGWGNYVTAPVVINYDSGQTVTAGQLGDQYLSTGLTTTFQHPMVRLSAGYSYTDGLKESTILSFWHDQRAPYTNPGQVVSTSLAFGEWHGISLYSNWLFSDTKPTIKAENQLSFHFHVPGRTRHLYFDVINSYWSERDASYGIIHGDTYGGSNAPNWNTPIINLDLKVTAEIRSFRLFWKVDNLLHRQQAYIPGYLLPGITFRWGFAWTILG